MAATLQNKPFLQYIYIPFFSFLVFFYCRKLLQLQTKYFTKTLAFM